MGSVHVPSEDQIPCGDVHPDHANHVDGRGRTMDPTMLLNPIGTAPRPDRDPEPLLLYCPHDQRWYTGRVAGRYVAAPGSWGAGFAPFALAAGLD